MCENSAAAPAGTATSAKRASGCGTPQPQPGCAVTVRFLQQTVRTTSPAEVFAQLLHAFELANANPSVVGLNLVAPEDHPVALRFHIRQAVKLAGASRIGHGVAVLYEDAPFQLLEEMRRRGVLVEICLTSNEVILNVANDNHPFLDYKRSGVPMALASDDEGVSRIDLSYRDLKTLARNSLHYSFLPGQSLWNAPSYQAFHPSCAADQPGAASLSAPCSALLNGSEKAQAQWKLKQGFASFEALPSFQSTGSERRRR